MRRLNVTSWESNHPLNGNPCPLTNRQIYIKDDWKVIRPDYRLRTGILERGVVLSLPIGHTKTGDTEAFFTIMHSILKSQNLDSDAFVLVEDYTLHTGSDYEGRVTYIKRMIGEVHPAGIVFIARSTNWKLSIKIGTALYGCPFPIKLTGSYRDALGTAGEILGRPLEGLSAVTSYDKIEHPDFTIALDIITPSLLRVSFTGCPSKNDLSSIDDFYLGLPHHSEVTKTFRIIHDFSAMTLPSIPLAVTIFKRAFSPLYNNGDEIAFVESAARGVSAILRLIGFFKKRMQHVAIYKDPAAAINAMQPDAEIIPVFRKNIQAAALEILESIAWSKPGYDDLETVSDPHLKPLALMLGSIKLDVDYYLQQRKNELENLKELNRSTRQLSREIEQAYLRSEEDRGKAEELAQANIALSQEIASSQKEVFLVLADYIDRRARFAAGTTRKLARLTEKIAALFGYRHEEQSRLHDAILLMHTGYLAIPELEPNPELHCTVGGEVLRQIFTVIMQHASDLARHHHEKWDGTGFPDRLQGECIPQDARLTAMAHYIMLCPADEIEDAIAIESGKSFDPVMVDTILQNIDRCTAFVKECDMVVAGSSTV